MNSLFIWKKAVRADQADVWTDKLGDHVPADRLAVVSRAGGRTLNLQAYLDSEEQADALPQRFGGMVCEVKVEDWMPAPATVPGKPLAFGRSLLVTGRSEELASVRSAHPRKHVLCIPAAMAFGTGEHATTAMCLRFLSEVGDELRSPATWRLLDLGTGSGVLALAARLFGAAKAAGYDNDPHAVRTAKENAGLNGIGSAKFRTLDLLHRPWPPGVGDGWPVVTANLFSELLISLLPQITAALAVGGYLITSGVLKSQSAEVEAAMLANGLEIVQRRQRGRWVAHRTRKSR